jgi:hypothetical protein
MPLSACTRSSSDASRPSACCPVPRPRPCCSGRSWRPVRSLCAGSTAGRPSTVHPPTLTLQPDPDHHAAGPAPCQFPPLPRHDPVRNELLQEIKVRDVARENDTGASPWGSLRTTTLVLPPCPRSGIEDRSEGRAPAPPVKRIETAAIGPRILQATSTAVCVVHKSLILQQRLFRRR